LVKRLEIHFLVPPMPRKTNLEKLLDVVVRMCSSLPLWVVPILAISVGLGIYVVLHLMFSPFAKNGIQIAIWFPLVCSWSIGFLVLAAGIKGWWIGRNRRLRYEEIQTIDKLRRLDWRQFELLVADFYREQGYQVIEGDGNAPDGGVDLMMRSPEGERIIVQCKHWRTSKIGVNVVREMLGVKTKLGVSRIAIVGTGSYTQEAIAFAEGESIELIDGETLLRRKTGEDRSSIVIHNHAPMGLCPICGSALVERVARRGRNAGSKFVGCSSFPRCRYTRN